MNINTFFAFDPNDSDEIRLEKFAIFLVAGACSLAGVVWTAMYYFVFGWGVTALLPLFFVVIVGGALILRGLALRYALGAAARSAPTTRTG